VYKAETETGEAVAVKKIKVYIIKIQKN